jgi:hypothetical protein
VRTCAGYFVHPFSEEIMCTYYFSFQDPRQCLLSHIFGSFFHKYLAGPKRDYLAQRLRSHRFHTYLAQCHKNWARLSKIFGGASNFERTSMPVLLVLKHVSLLVPTSGGRACVASEEAVGSRSANESSSKRWISCSRQLTAEACER